MGENLLPLPQLQVEVICRQSLSCLSTKSPQSQLPLTAVTTIMTTTCSPQQHIIISQYIILSSSPLPPRASLSRHHIRKVSFFQRHDLLYFMCSQFQHLFFPREDIVLSKCFKCFVCVYVLFVSKDDCPGRSLRYGLPTCLKQTGEFYHPFSIMKTDHYRFPLYTSLIQSTEVFAGSRRKFSETSPISANCACRCCVQIQHW